MKLRENEYLALSREVRGVKDYSKKREFQNIYKDLLNRYDLSYKNHFLVKISEIDNIFNEKRYEEAGAEYLALSREVRGVKDYSKKREFQNIYKDLLNRYDLSYKNHFLVKISEIDNKFKEKEYEISGDEYLALSREVKTHFEEKARKKREFQNIYKDLLNRYDLSYKNYFLVKISEIDNKFKEKEYEISGAEYLALSREVRGVKDYSKKREFQNIYKDLLNRYDLSYKNHFLVKISEIDNIFNEKRYEEAGAEYLEFQNIYNFL